jgi:ribosomal protein S12 methylthiotransferase
VTTGNFSSIAAAPKIGMVSLGCPKALVDSERIISRLRADGYEMSGDYHDAGAVIVNTCGFLDSAKAESLEAIGEALAENGKVIVTGCMGKDPDDIMAAHPNVLAVTGPQAYEDVVNAVRSAVPIIPNPLMDLAPRSDSALPLTRLTPRHYAYLKISEGCNHRCRFCIIPSMRGMLKSRSAADILYEADRLAQAGVKELLVISQDTSAYGVDISHRESKWRGEYVAARLTDLTAKLGEIGPWIRLHYVYPYPSVDAIIPLMAEGKVLPYLDIPFQHASPSVLTSMRRPANQEKTLDRIAAWRKIVPDIALRSTFIVGFPGETESDFAYLLQWLEAAQLDRVGCFQYENVAGAAANALPDHVPEALKQERWERFMQAAQAISARKLEAKVGRQVTAIVDEVDDSCATARTFWDAPGVDGNLFIDAGFEHVEAGDIVTARIDEAGDYDLWGVLTE